MSKIKEIPLSHWNMPNLLREWKFEKPRYWCPKRYVGWGGLGVHFHRNGRVFWEVNYNLPGQPKKIAVLGELHPQNYRYQEAFAAGKAIKEAAKRGVDLRAEAKVSRDTAPTVREMGERFLAEWSKPRKRTADRDETLLKNHVFPAIGSMAPPDVEYEHVFPIVKIIADRGAPGQADMVKAVMSKMFNWGRAPFKVKYNPTLGIPAFNHRAVEDDAILGAVPLTLNQIKKFWHGLDELPIAPVTKLYARFLLLTGVRPSEAVGARWSEFAFAEPKTTCTIWTIPGIRMKKGKSHRVPISTLAEQMLNDASAYVDQSKQAFVFPSPHPRQLGADITLRPRALGHAMALHAKTLGLKPGQSPYSLRKFVATTIGGLCHPGTSIHYTDEDVGLILAHKRSGVTAKYNQSLYDEPKRAMLQQLADEIRKRI